LTHSTTKYLFVLAIEADEDGENATGGIIKTPGDHSEVSATGFDHCRGNQTWEALTHHFHGHQAKCTMQRRVQLALEDILSLKKEDALNNKKRRRRIIINGKTTIPDWV